MSGEGYKYTRQIVTEIERMRKEREEGRREEGKREREREGEREGECK